MQRRSSGPLRSSPLAAIVAGLALAACGAQRSQSSASGEVELAVQALSSADVAGVSVTVAGPALPAPRVSILYARGAQWGALLGGLPAGTGYTFTVAATDAGGTVIYTGSASNITILRGQTVVVVITAQQAKAPDAFQNAFPVIDSLVISSASVAPGDQVSAKVLAHDPNPLDTVTLQWQSTCGTFADATVANAIWTAPVAATSCTVSIKVTDQRGASVSASWVIGVDSANGKGQAQVSVTTNTWPTITNLSVSPNGWLDAGTTTGLTVTAADADNDPLSYVWTSPCAGAFNATNVANPTFVLASGQTGVCTITVTVGDGRGGSTVGDITLPIGGPAVNQAPVIVDYVQSATTAISGQAINLLVDATDPEGTALTFQWATDGGTFSGEQDSATSSRVVWTAPATASGDWQAAVTVTDVHGAATTQVFTISPVVFPTVDISRYVRVGRYNLPEPTRTLPPDGTSLLAQEASSVTFNWDTNTLFVVGDGGTSVVQVSKTGVLINSMTLAPGSSPQGTEFYDTEGISYVGGGKFLLNEERYRQVNLFTYVPGATLHRSDVQTVKLGTTIGNIGLEGVTYDPKTGHYIFVKEKDPRSIFETGIDFAAGTATNGSPTTDESIDLFDPSRVSTLDFSDIYALSNLPSLAGDSTYDQLLIISQESGKIVQVDRSGNVKHTLTLVADPGDTISVPDMTMEGITMDRDRILYVVNENGGGDVNHPQLWVYAPSTAANLAPTAISLAGAVTSIPDNTNTTGAVNLAQLFVADDGLGDNSLSLSGPDAGSFQIIGTALFLKAGTVLDAATQSSYHVTLNVDDTTVGGTPDASTSYTLAITPAASGVINLAVTEVAAWSSGNSPLASDWFEVTNFGTSSVSLVGWTMDDNSNSFAVSVPLNGVTSIAPGKSVIFIETADSAALAAKAQTFINVWFGGTAPAGLQIGSYSGSGVGLSTGGDAVNLFDLGGTLRAAVSFGPSPSGTPLATFDNSAGQSNAVLANLSVVGQNGAFVAATDAAEIGSPGTIGAGAVPIVGITAVDGLASESGSDPGVFRFTRSGGSASPLTVIYTFAAGVGQATPDDYTPALTGSQIIPAGAAFVDVTITPVDDAIVEGSETLTLKLSDTGSYDVGPDANATVTIQDNDSANLAPTAVTLLNTVSSLSEAADVSSHVRLADISVADDGLGTNTLSLSGTDAASFEIVGVSLYLKAGTSLSHASKPTLGVTVAVDDPTVGGSPDATVGFTLTVTQSVAPGTLVISEIAPWSSASSPLAADWFEVTNTGNSAVDLTGWKMDDNSHSIANAIALNGITSIAPGEAVIFIETANLTTAAATFRSLWFAANPPRATQIGSYSGSGVGLSSSGDEVVLFDGAGNLVTGVGFGASPSGTFATFDNHAGAGRSTLPLPVLSTLTSAGVNGAFVAAGDANEIGSPGIGNIGRLIITEVAPWGSSTPPYSADWFEVTNIGGAAVDMSGWKMDDNSNSFALSVPIVGVGSIAPGQSAVLIEGTATNVGQFVTAWFGTTPPAGFLIGSYTGSGVGLGATSDAVNLFNPAGKLIAGVQFGAATTGFTFDNRAGLTTVTTLSTAGVGGAFLASDGIETGSPGTTH